jgi:micrococcal nuclease
MATVPESGNPYMSQIPLRCGRNHLGKINGVALLLFSLSVLMSCSTTETKTSSGVAWELPTARPPVTASPVSTRVFPVESLTPAPKATITPIPDEVLGLVVEVIDGETILVVLDGDPMSRTYGVRYIGVDAPPNMASAPWGIVATEANRNLTNLRVVRLVRDKAEADDDGFLLRYVYVDDDLVNITLAEQGLVRASLDDENRRFATAILAAEAEAQSNKIGVWAGAPPTATIELAPVATTSAMTSTPAISVTPTAGLTITATVTVTRVNPEATGTPDATVTGTITQTQTATATATEAADDELLGPSN